MKRYFIAYEKDDDQYFDSIEEVKVIESKNDTLNFLSNIISDANSELVSIVHYDFARNTSKVYKPTLNQKLKLDLEEEN